MNHKKYVLYTPEYNCSQVCQLSVKYPAYSNLFGRTITHLTPTTLGSPKLRKNLMLFLGSVGETGLSHDNEKKISIGPFEVEVE